MKQFNSPCLPYESLKMTFLGLGVKKPSQNQPNEAATPTLRNGRVQLLSLFQGSTTGSNFTQATPQAMQGRTMKLSTSGPLGFSGTLGETDCVTQYRP